VRATAHVPVLALMVSAARLLPKSAATGWLLLLLPQVLLPLWQWWKQQLQQWQQQQPQVTCGGTGLSHVGNCYAVCPTSWVRPSLQCCQLQPQHCVQPWDHEILRCCGDATISVAAAKPQQNVLLQLLLTLRLQEQGLETSSVPAVCQLPGQTS